MSLAAALWHQLNSEVVLAAPQCSSFGALGARHGTALIEPGKPWQNGVAELALPPRSSLVAFDAFVETWGVKYDKAVECLIKDRDALLAFYDFPAEHWKHLRTTNIIESSFATVRHRTVRSKGCLSNKTALAMIFKLTEAAEKSWRRLDGHNQLPKVQNRKS